jgi:CheY-like chemotaxis protein
MQTRIVDILLVEDNPGDVRLTREAFKDESIPTNLHVVQDGEQAMRFLKGETPYQSAVRPDLILLDLHLPRKNGLETLAEIKNDPDLRAIPVIMLTTSKAEEDVMKAYDLHANCFVTKPLDMGQFIHTVEMIKKFWIMHAMLLSDE